MAGNKMHKDSKKTHKDSKENAQGQPRIGTRDKGSLEKTQGQPRKCTRAGNERHKY